MLYSLKGNSFPRSCSKVSGISSSKEALLFVSVFISVCSLSCCSILIHPPTYLDTSRQQKKKKNYTSSGDLCSRLSEKKTFFAIHFFFFACSRAFPHSTVNLSPVSVLFIIWTVTQAGVGPRPGLHSAPCRANKRQRDTSWHGLFYSTPNLQAAAGWTAKYLAWDLPFVRVLRSYHQQESPGSEIGQAEREGPRLL